MALCYSQVADEHIAEEFIMAAQDVLVWVDMEMTGLDPERDVVLEIATIVTDAHLDVIEEGPVLAIHQDDAVLGAMDEWNTRQHGHSGLVDRVRRSTMDEAEAERQTLAFLARHAVAGRSPMFGKSSCQDRRFMVRHMPRLGAFFSYPNLERHHRNEMVRRRRRGVYSRVRNPGRHPAPRVRRERNADRRS